MTSGWLSLSKDVWSRLTINFLLSTSRLYKDTGVGFATSSMRISEWQECVLLQFLYRHKFQFFSVVSSFSSSSSSSHSPPFSSFCLFRRKRKRKKKEEKNPMISAEKEQAVKNEKKVLTELSSGSFLFIPFSSSSPFPFFLFFFFSFFFSSFSSFLSFCCLSGWCVSKSFDFLFVFVCLFVFMTKSSISKRWCVLHPCPVFFWWVRFLCSLPLLLLLFCPFSSHEKDCLETNWLIPKTEDTEWKG